MGKIRCFFSIILLVLSLPLNGHGYTNLIDQRFPSKDNDVFLRFKHGLVLLVREDVTAPTVSVQVLVKAGSLYEPPLSGLSHYLEHVVAGGSTTFFTEGEGRKKIEALGGASNAYTSYDKTVYYINTSKENWKEALDLLLAFVHDCAFEPSEVEREKGVILEEQRMGENDPSKQLWYLFFGESYKKHPVGNPVIGRMDVFVRQTREDLLNYYKRLYTPGNMVVAVVGGVNRNEVMEYVGEKTKDWIDTPAGFPVFPEETAVLGPRVVEKELEFIQQERVMVGFPTVDLFHPDAYALDVLAVALGEGKSSLFHRKLKEEQNLVSQVSAFHWSPSFVKGRWIVSFMPVPAKRDETLKSLQELFKYIRDHGISHDDLERAKNKILSEHIFGKETPSEQATSLITSFNETGDPYFDDVYVEKIKAVRDVDVKKVAEQYLRWDKTVIAVVSPSGSKVGEGRGEGEGGKDNRAAMETKDPHLLTLPNGLRVVLKREDKLPIVALELHGLGGQVVEPSDKPGLSYLTASLLTAGGAHYSREDIFNIIESKGGAIESGSNRNTYFISIRVLKEHLYEAINILSDIVSHAAFPDDEVAKKKKELLLKIDREKENWQQELLLAFHERYFRNHPYKGSVLGTKDVVERISKQDVEAFYRRMVVPKNSVLAVYGDFDEEQLVNHLKGKLVRWDRGAGVSLNLPEEWKGNQDGEAIVLKNKKTTSGIIVGSAGLAMDDPKRVALDIIDAYISGISYPGGRLQEALRGGTENLVYVVHAFPFYGIKGGYFAVIAQAAPEKLEKVRNIIIGELKKTWVSPPAPEDIKRARDIIFTMTSLSTETLQSQAQEAASYEALGLGWNYRQKLNKELDKVTPSLVADLAKNLFSSFLVIETYPEDYEETK